MAESATARSPPCGPSTPSNLNLGISKAPKIQRTRAPAYSRALRQINGLVQNAYSRMFSSRNRNRNRKLQTSKAPLKSQAQGTSLFTSAASNQRGFPKNSPWEGRVRFPEGKRMRQIRGVFQRIVRGKLRSGCQKVRGGRLGVRTTEEAKEEE